MAVGNIGRSVVFETSDSRILTFQNFTQIIKGRWASHTRTGEKPARQFLGPEVASLTFTITLSAEHGVQPRTTAENLELLVERGIPQTVVIGGRQVGHAQFVVTEISESWERIYNQGEVVRMTCNITMEEYQ